MRRAYEAELAGLVDAGSSLGVPGPDQLAISFSETALHKVAVGLVDGLEALLREALPSDIPVPVLGVTLSPSISVELTQLRLVERRDAAGVLVGFRLAVSMNVPAVGEDLAVGVSGDLRLLTALAVEQQNEVLMLVVRMPDSALQEFRLTPTGLAGLGSFGWELAERLERAVRRTLDPVVLAQLGHLPLVELRHLRIEGAVVSLMANGIRVEPDMRVGGGRRLWVGLRTDLALPTSSSMTIPRLNGPPADVEVMIPAGLGRPLLSSVLGHGGGRRFDEDGRFDEHGAYRVTVGSLEPRASGADFDYRLYRTAAPCLVADFSGEARIGLGLRGAQVEVERHELVYASRFADAVEQRLPPTAELSRTLTDLLAQALTVEAVSLPVGLQARLELETLEMDVSGYAAGWSIEALERESNAAQPLRRERSRLIVDACL